MANNGADGGNGGIPPAPPQTPPTPGGKVVGTRYPLKSHSTGEMIYAVWKGTHFDTRPEVTSNVTTQGKLNFYYILTHMQGVKCTMQRLNSGHYFNFNQAKANI